MKISKKQKRSFKKSDAILSSFLIASLVLFGVGIDIYRQTIIDPWYLVAAMVAGAIVTPLLLLRWIRFYELIVWMNIAKAIIGGGVFYFAFLFLNLLFANTETETGSFKIVKAGHMIRGKGSNCPKPYAIIDFNRTRKRLFFSCDYEDDIRNYSRVSVEFSKGLFGFVVVRSQELIIDY